jgi:hypothetical protein
LVDHHLVRFTGVANHVDRAFGRRPHRWNTDIHCIGPNVRSLPLREIPLGSAGRRAGARSRKADNAALCACHRNVVPASVGGFIETKRAVVHNDTHRRGARIFKRRPRWIDLRAVIHE